MANMQVFPGGEVSNSITINGRSYTCASGSVITVPDFDGFVMLSNGWHASAKDGAGTTAQRPVNPSKGAEFFDSTLGVKVIFNGKNWINSATGAVV